jgi:hypothetical protein
MQEKFLTRFQARILAILRGKVANFEFFDFPEFGVFAIFRILGDEGV